MQMNIIKDKETKGKMKLSRQNDCQMSTNIKQEVRDTSSTRNCGCMNKLRWQRRAKQETVRTNKH